MKGVVRRSTSACLLLRAIAIALAILSGSVCGQSQGNPSPPSRPILFVYGFCDSGDSWVVLRTEIASRLNSDYPTLYPPPNAAYGYGAYYDGQSVHFVQNGSEVVESTIPQSARIFSMIFYDQNSGKADPQFVAQVSILNKGDELAHVLREITKVTGITDSIVVAHSMGGLVSRTYLENLASSTACYDYNVGSNGSPDYSQASCKPGGTLYTGEIAKLITIDTPHGGAAPAASVEQIIAPLFPACSAGDSTNRLEQVPGSQLLDSLNFNAPDLGHTRQPIPSSTKVDSIESSYSGGNPTFDSVTLGFGSTENDGLVSKDAQSLESSLNAAARNPSQFLDFSNSYSVDVLSAQLGSGCLGPSITINGTVTVAIFNPYLHFLACVGSQQNTFNIALPLIESSITGTYVVTSPPPPPTVTTLPATAIGSDGANLNGTVNPNGSAATAWIEYGTSNALKTFQKTTVQSITSGTSSVPLTYGLSSQPANTTYYYRSAASNNTNTVRDTNIVSFTTLNTLQRPTLLTPANASTGVSAVPQFSWTAVPNATSGYRVMMSTSQSALPTDPNSSTCALGCVLGTTGATTSGTTFTPSAGQLSPSTQYFWEVHGRGPTQAGDWSLPIWSFTTASAVSNDFSIQVSPLSQSVSQGSSVAYNVVTATTSGSGQSVTLSASNVPSGLTASFSPAATTSGGQSTLTLAATSSAPTGTYTLTITGTGPSSTHTYQVSVTVAQAASGPAVTLNPSIVRFNSQAVGSVSSPQTVLLMNSGTGQLRVSSIALSPGSDYALTLPSPAPPSILNSLVPYNIQVAFEPTTTGTRSGEIIVYDNAPGSPHIVSLTGAGASAPPTAGTINVSATLNGVALPSSYGYQYSLVGPSTYTGGNAYSFAVTPGSYSISFTSSPTYLTLSSVTPSAVQSVSAGGTISYTLNFTAPNDFYAPSFLTSGGGVTPQIVTAGSTANYTVGIGVPSGSVSTPITLAVSGTPVNSSPVFNPEPASSAVSSALTVGTTSATPIGVYTLSLSGTNSSGLIHECCTSTLVVTAPPLVPVQLASKSSGGVQANAASSVSYDSVSSDGRYVLFLTPATNLAPGNTFQYSELYVRDIQSLVTTPVSVSNSGVLADSGCFGGSISANGQFAVFWTGADNLYSGSNLNVTNGVYVRDLVHGTTEREDLAQNGTPANGTSFGSAISADGRFVAFVSSATNLVSGVSGMQAYLRDRTTGKIVLVSAAMDGSPASSDSEPLAISADGRYVAFVSNSTKLVLQNTNGLNEAFVRDASTGTTSLVSVSSSGSPANSSVYTNANQVPLGLSADGRFVAFSSLATNLVAEPLDGSIVHVFLYDRQFQQNALIDVDSVGTPLGGWPSFTAPAVSADGRFISFNGFGQELIRDIIENQTAVVSLPSSGSAGNNITNAVNSSIGGSEIVFASQATNLVANDSNGVVDAFIAQNPFVGSSLLQSLTLGTSSAPGGSIVTGTLTLSGPAPAGGATVAVWSNNAAAQPPAAVLVPAGATSIPISITTALVPSEEVMTIMASYNGGSSVALLTLEPAAQLVASPATWDFGYQPISTNSPAESITLTNSGTAALAINSVQLSSGQVFSISSNTCGSSIVAGASCSISVAFKPTASGAASDALQVSYGSPATIQSIPLTGNGATPVASISPGTLTLTSPANTTATATLTNSGNAPLSGVSASISGANAGDYAVSSDGCSGVILPANSSCLITIAFLPKATGTRLATLSVADSASGSPQIVGLTGSQAQATPTVQWSPSTTSLIYGASLGSGVLDAAATVNGNGVVGNFAYTATIGGGAPQAVSPATILGAGGYALTATFTPADTVNYTTATVTTSITVNRATPTLTWNLPATMTYGIPLGSAQLNATSSLPGTFAYSPSTGTILTAGINSLGVTFTPTDTADYSSATASFSITVNQATPMITWSTPSPIANGTALSTAQLDATASVPGTFVYSPGAGTVLTAGSHMLSVTFTPTDITDYNAASATVSISVGSTAPTITWNSPPSIVYGTPLTTTQLNATTSVPGAFIYSPAAGTVLTAGSHSLSVTFTPTDTINYAAATATTSITVNPAAPSITWNAPATITYGTAVGTTQLNAVASVPGTFVYSPGTGTTLTAGIHSLGTTFSPTDSTDYTTVVKTVSITVNPATPAITWPIPAPIASGAVLGAAQLNATSSVPGTFIYSPAAGTLLAVGSHSITAIFSPTDAVDYTTASATVSITVNGTTPTITWNNAAAITYGSPLTAIQLNATASVPGTFTYSPTSGTILAAGNQALSVTFNPTDTVNYKSASATNTVTVNPAPLTVSVANASRAYGASNPAFATSVSGAVNGDTFTTSGSTSATISSNVGNYSIVPTVSGTDISDYTVNPVNGTLTIVPAASTVSVSSSNLNANLSSSVTLTAGATSATTGIPTGTVNFFDGQVLLGSVLLNGQGIASYTSSSLVAGPHSITAVYTGNADFSGSTSSVLNQTVIAPDYSVVSNPTTLTVQRGQTGTAAFTVTPVGGFNQAIQFSCSGLPVHSACSFSPGTITPSGTAVSSNLTITTDVNTSLLSVPSLRPSLELASYGRIAIGSCLLFWIFGRRRIDASRRRSLWVLVAGIGLLGVGMALAGCGANPQPLPITPTGTSSVTITAATSGTNGISHSATLVFTVTQ